MTHTPAIEREEGRRGAADRMLRRLLRIQPVVREPLDPGTLGWGPSNPEVIQAVLGAADEWDFEHGYGPLAELQTRVEYGHQTEEFGWIHEPRGIKYATHQRTVHYRIDEPRLIDHWSDPDDRKPFPAGQPAVEGSAE
jgi:hypothetical protein